MGNIVSLPQSMVKGCKGINTIPWQITSPMQIQYKFYPLPVSNFNDNGNITVVINPITLHKIKRFLYFRVLSAYTPKIPAEIIPVIIIAVPKSETQLEVKPQGSKISSRSEPQMLNVPLTVPNANARDINFLSLNIIPIDFLKSTVQTIEPKLGKVGGLYLKNIIIKIEESAAIITSTINNMKKLSLMTYLVSVADTKRGGITNPIAVPIMFTTVNTAIAKDLYIYSKTTFWGINHLVAIFIGAFKRNGWAMAQNTWPTTTKAKLTFTRHLIRQPRKVKEAPITTPFLIPLTSMTQFEGKLRIRKKIIQDIGMNATQMAETSQVFWMGTEIGVTTTQHMPLMMEAVLYRIVMTMRQVYSLNQYGYVIIYLDVAYIIFIMKLRSATLWHREIMNLQSLEKPIGYILYFWRTIEQKKIHSFVFFAFVIHHFNLINLLSFLNNEYCLYSQHIFYPLLTIAKDVINKQHKNSFIYQNILFMISKIITRGLNQGLTLNVKRFFDLHQYQSKDLMRKYGILVQRGTTATTPDQAYKVAKDLNVKDGDLILKAQVHAGGRGKGQLTSGMKGGVQILKTPEEVRQKTKKMIGYNLITHQTTKEGLKVNAVLVHEGVDIKRQIYFAFILDRNTQGPAIVASTEGGVQIQQVAKKNPSAVKVYPVDIKKGITPELLKQLQKDLELEKVPNYAEQVKNLYRLFIECDATQLQINPWATDPTNKIFSVDAKINIDDNAKFRQKQLTDLKKNSLASQDIDPHEEKAVAAGLNYVALDGNIGCMVNGAGLAMATMDIIKLKGGEPANFLDVGGGANVEQVKTAFEILSSHPKVKAILINIFGGIMKCDTIAEGIFKAAELVDLKLPLVCRLTGTNADKANKMIEEFSKKNPKFKITAAIDLDDAAVKSVAKAQGH